MKMQRFTILRAAGAALLAVAFAAPSFASDPVVMVCEVRGGQVNPPTGSAGFGCGRFIIDTDANTVSYRIAFTGMTGPDTAAHIHGPADIGANAGVQHNLGTGNPKVGVWTYPEALEGDILGGKMYVNIHSAAFPGGEIRGQIVDMVASLNGAQNGNGTPSSGWGAFMIDTATNTLDYHIVIESLTAAETAAHIHGYVPHGTNAGVAFGLGVGAVKTGSWTYPEANEAKILGGLTYVNVHTTAFPGGEIRGQITSLVNPLDSQQEVPPVASPGSAGCAFLSIDTDANVLGYDFRYGGLSGAATASHIHGFAAPGANAGVLHGVGTANPAVGQWAFAAAQQPDLLAGLTYYNVHTAAFPGGNVRGQLRFDFKPPAPPCVEDLDNDGTVGPGDLAQLLAAWGPNPGHPADFDNDGTVGPADLAVLLAAWGPC